MGDANHSAPSRSGRHLYREEWRLQPRAAGVAIPRQGQGNHLQQQLPRWVCLLLPPLCCLSLANPALLQPFSLLESWLSHTSIQAGGKPKGGAYLPARQLPGAGMLSTSASHLLHLHPSLCLRISDSRGPGAPFHGLCRQWGTGEDLAGPYKLACAEQNSVYLCSSCLRFLPAGAAGFQTPGQAECPISRKRREGCA